MIVNQWRVFCQTESTYKYIWLQEGQTPTQCPDDSGHTIVPAQSVVVYSINDEKPEVVTNKGKKDFLTQTTHNLCDSQSWVGGISDSSFTFEPPSEKMYEIPKAEVQFSHDVQIASLGTSGKVYFDTWVYNPLYDPQTTTDPDDPAFVPEQSSGNPLRFLYERQEFDSIAKVLELGNQHYTCQATVDGIPGFTTIRFDYDQLLELKSSQGAQIRVSTEGDNPLGGTFCSVSLILRELNE